MKLGLIIPEMFVMPRFSTTNLHPGIVTVKLDQGRGEYKVDEILTYSIPSGGCRGKHFKSRDKRDICYLPGGIVAIVNLREYHSYKSWMEAQAKELIDMITGSVA